MAQLLQTNNDSQRSSDSLDDVLTNSSCSNNHSYGASINIFPSTFTTLHPVVTVEENQGFIPLEQSFQIRPIIECPNNSDGLIMKTSLHLKERIELAEPSAEVDEILYAEKDAPIIITEELLDHCQIYEIEDNCVTNIVIERNDLANHGTQMFDDRCNTTLDCGFMNSVCYSKRCHCSEDYPISNHIDKCGKAARINDSCTFHEQCEALNDVTVCRDGMCICKFDRHAIVRPDGSSECIVIENTSSTDEFVAPTMIGILVVMGVMFIIICVVLRLFSNARWRENRSIFNTPNPRLMNVSLLRDSKILHQERRGSKGSIPDRVPSRQPSMASLRAHSPNSQGSRGSSNASVRSNKSPPMGPAVSDSAASTPMLESVTVEIRN